MDEPVTDIWVTALVLIIWPSSIATWIALFVRMGQRGTILDYQPRKQVPWRAPVAFLAILFVVVTLLAGIGEQRTRESVDKTTVGDEKTDQLSPDERMDSSDVAERLLGFIVFQTMVIGGVLGVIAIVYRPNWRDFGLPTSTDKLLQDVKIGVVAWLAALAPVQGIQVLMLWLFDLNDEQARHPLIEMVTSGGPSILLLLLASVAAIVVAPLTEEILFRLLLQGWLEKWEHVWVRLRDGSPAQEISNDEVLIGVLQPANDQLAITQENQKPDYLVLPEAAPADSAAPPDLAVADPQPISGAGGLPYGYLPILGSALPFALAHYGYGPDPIAIFVLALILGYVYQRTHRILPCMITHALFNSVAVLVLWRMVFSKAG